MAERIYTRSEGGQLEPLEEEPFSTEDELQALIADHPELLDGEQMRPGDPRRWILIKREKGIAETSDSGARWSIDHLIVDQDAVPTLAEVKRGSNPEIRRTIVGQMLEYAAHAAQTWNADDLRQTFEDSANAQGLDPGEALGRLLEKGEEPDADVFWQKVATNLAARRIRLLFVAMKYQIPLRGLWSSLTRRCPMSRCWRSRSSSSGANRPRRSSRASSGESPRIHSRPCRFAPEANTRVVPGRVCQRRISECRRTSSRRSPNVRLHLRMGAERCQHPRAMLALAAADHTSLALPAVQGRNGLDANQRLHLWCRHS